MINYDYFAKLILRVGEIKKVEIVSDADKLLKLIVDFGEEEPRQIISGIREYFENPAILEGVKCAFVTNLEPRVIRGLESRGMILAAHDPEGHFSLLTVSKDIPAGTKIN